MRWTPLQTQRTNRQIIKQTGVSLCPFACLFVTLCLRWSLTLNCRTFRRLRCANAATIFLRSIWRRISVALCGRASWRLPPEVIRWRHRRQRRRRRRRLSDTTRSWSSTPSIAFDTSPPHEHTRANYRRLTSRSRYAEVARAHSHYPLIILKCFVFYYF